MLWAWRHSTAFSHSLSCKWQSGGMASTLQISPVIQSVYVSGSYKSCGSVTARASAAREDSRGQCQQALLNAQ